MLKTKAVLQNVDLPKAADIGARLKSLVGQLSEIFPEREYLLQQLLYALLTKEHVLVFGTFGTGKSDLLHTCFTAFTGARVFSIELTKFMTEANLIGIPDPTLMRRKGEVHYRRDGGILDADFAELDELLDSSGPLLRTLLGILNERQFKRGRQVEDAKLHTAVASTNGDPQKEMARQPELGAVIDRFLFHCRVGYLQSEQSRCRMYLKYLSGARPEVQIPLEDLQYLSGIVTDANQITDEYLVQVHDRIVEGWVAKLGGPDKVRVSDRRRCKLLQLAEANALLYGRYDVHLEDLMAIKWGLCEGGNKAHAEAFEAVAKPIIDEAKAKQPQSVDEVQIRLLTELETKTPVVPQNCAGGDLVELVRKTSALIKEIEAVRPLLPSTIERQKASLKKLADLRAGLMSTIENGK